MNKTKTLRDEIADIYHDFNGSSLYSSLEVADIILTAVSEAMPKEKITKLDMSYYETSPMTLIGELEEKINEIIDKLSDIQSVLKGDAI